MSCIFFIFANIFIQMEKVIDENKQGTSLVLNQKQENTKKLFIESYGCAMNFSDSEVVASILTNEGYNTTNILEEADLVEPNYATIKHCQTFMGTMIIAQLVDRSFPIVETII